MGQARMIFKCSFHQVSDWEILEARNTFEYKFNAVSQSYGRG